MVKRYWRVTVAGLGFGFLLGVALFGVIALSSLDWIAYFSWAEFFRSVFSYGLIGLLVAFAACAGGWLAVAMSDRRLEAQPSVRIRSSRYGAAIATVTFGILAGSLAAGQELGSWLVVILGLTIALALVSAVAAGALVSYAERRYAGPVSTLT